MIDPKDGNLKHSRGPVLGETPQNETLKMIARVGEPAPDFKLKAYEAGKLREVQLSKCQGKWVVLLFYPGDFTFV